MNNRFIKTAAKFAYQILLGCILMLVFFTNFESGTILTGWDNHHIEYNPMLYLERSLTSVWQGWGGVGAVGGMSFAADLPRVLLLFPLMLIMPLEIIRYLYTFFCLGFGAYGMYVLSRNLVLSKVDNSNLREFLSFSSALFYVFNIGTLQLFYTTLEMFITGYAFIPWLIWAVIRSLENATPKKLFLLGVLSFFGTPMAITPTVFINYALIVSIIFIIFIYKIIKKKDYKRLKPIVLSALVLIITNLFWVLPAAYALTNKAEVVSNSRTATLATPDIRDYGQTFATWEDFPILRSFWFGQNDMVFLEDGVQPDWQPLMGEWINHFDSPVVLVGYLFFSIIVLGFISSFFLKDSLPYRGIMWACFLIGSFMLLGEANPTGIVFSALSNSSSFLAEIFRLPFSKFIYISLIGFSSFFSIGLLVIISFLNKIKIVDFNAKEFCVATLLLVFAFVTYMLPAFSGNFLFKEIRVNVPDEYFELFTYLETQSPDKRILYLPANSWAGWQYYDWGYRGSGFLWYGIEQPIIDRAFDVWGEENEAVYLEVVTAIQSGNNEQLESIVNKYQISYLLLDKNVVDFAGGDKALLFDLTTQVANENNYLKVFEEEELVLFETGISSNTEIIRNTISIEEEALWRYRDYTFESIGNYINSGKPDIIYPFASIEERNDDITFYEQDGKYIFETIINSNGDFVFTEDDLNGVNYYLDGKRLTNKESYKLDNGQVFKVEISNNFVVNEVDLGSIFVDKCFADEGSTFSSSRSSKYIDVYSKAGTYCISVPLNSLSQNSNYLVSISADNISGRTLQLNIDNSIRNIYQTVHQLGNESSEQFFVIKPGEENELGYVLTLFNKSILQSSPTHNQIKSINLYSLPISNIANSGFSASKEVSTTVTEIESIKYSSTKYGFKSIDLSGDYVLNFNQSFHNGWNLYRFDRDLNQIDIWFPFLTGQKVSEEEHVKVNGWSNGWVLEGNSNYIAWYTPQLLETVGLVTIGCSFIVIITFIKRNE